MKLFVGLGNPAKDYENTRHNVGASFVDFLVRKLGLSYQTKFRSLYADAQVDGEKVIFIKPQTFMNLSGDAVSEVVKFYKIEFSDIFIAFDDLDIKEGEYKIQLGKYPKVHNGVNDIIAKLGTSEINFIRIGIDGRNEEERKFMAGSDYVLSRLDFDFKGVFGEIEKKLGIKNYEFKQ
jgi:PTH1 family peptidyl-tRNA hydrolase